MSNDIQAKINNVDLYEDRKIAQIATANNLIDGLTAKGKQREKGIKAYEKAIAKHQDKERVSEKQTKALEKARETKTIKGKLRKATDKERGIKQICKQRKKHLKTENIIQLNIFYLVEHQMARKQEGC